MLEYIVFGVFFQLDISHIYIVVWEPFPFSSILNFNSFDIIGISIASVFYFVIYFLHMSLYMSLFI